MLTTCNLFIKSVRSFSGISLSCNFESMDDKTAYNVAFTSLLHNNFVVLGFVNRELTISCYHSTTLTTKQKNCFRVASTTDTTHFSGKNATQASRESSCKVAFLKNTTTVKSRGHSSKYSHSR